MAPPPEYDKEPKAPDKSATNISCEESKALHDLVNDQPTNSDNKPVNTIPSADVENNKHVETLDDGQLRALLDEAITYKSPKDRAGKSSLFKELLEEVEQDEQACEAAARSVGAARGGGLPHSNSLQDLVAAALAAEPAPRRRHHAHAHAAPPSVSARALHGGSLPSGVDTSFLLGEEPARGAGYLATVRCVNPPPLTERRVSATDANCANDLDIISRRSKPAFPMTYTARATLEIGSGSVCSGRAVTTTTASNQVDSAIPFGCITTPEVVASCNTTSSTTQSTVAVDPKPRSVISSSINGLPLSRPNGSTATTLQEEYKKSLDENGNSVQGFSSPMSGSSQHNKKPRRKKSSKNETVITSHQIDGYQGNKDLNEVLRFIESNAESTRANKLGRAKHKDDSDDKAGKKRADRRKDKETKIKRATSMEELSRTRLCSLTDGASVSVSGRRGGGTDTTLPKPERRSWGDDARDPYYAYDDNATTATATATVTPTLHDNDFQTVTKKRKPRRRTDESSECTVGVGIGVGAGGLAGCGVRGGGGGGGGGAGGAAGGRALSPRGRRVSAPPSDRSNDSNDDMESVHSLPGDAARALPASYADIARTRHNIPDLIESCNYYGEGVGGVRGSGGGERGDRVGGPGGGGHHGGGGGGAGSGGAADADTYPALEPRRKPRQTKPAKPPPPRRERKERLVCDADGPAVEGGECAECGECGDAAPAPDVLGVGAGAGAGSGGRPAVILLDAPAKPRDMDGVTFGFDINEQLLGGPSRRPRCDLVRDAMEGADDVVADADVDTAATHTDVDVDADAEGIGTGSAVAAAAAAAAAAAVRALRYVPPATPTDSAHLLQIVDYVGTAWDDVMRCGAGKVRYYSE